MFSPFAHAFNSDDIQPGEPVPAFVTGPDRLGDVFVTDETLDKAEACASTFAEHIRFLKES